MGVTRTQEAIPHLKKILIDKAKKIEKEKILNGFEFSINGVVYNFDADEKAQRFLSALLSSYSAGKLPSSIEYTVLSQDKQNKLDLDLQTSEIPNIHFAGIVHVKTWHEWRRAHETAINALGTIQELEGYNIL